MPSLVPPSLWLVRRTTGTNQQAVKIYVLWSVDNLALVSPLSVDISGSECRNLTLIQWLVLQSAPRSVDICGAGRGSFGAVLPAGDCLSIRHIE
jgi:hypothetical protein